MMVLLLSACGGKPTNAEQQQGIPQIFPDYTNVTIPVDIAPMNFTAISDGENARLYVIAKGSKGGEITSSGEYTDFDIDEWHQLTEQNKGADIFFTVFTENDGKWKQYQDFRMHVSKHEMDAYGLTYRLISPGYEVGGDIGIYQRDLHNFNEAPILRESAVPGQCFNCHTANQTSGEEFLIHLRGSQGGTVIQRDGKQEWLNTKTDSTKANFGYSYWHPSGKYLATSVNSIHQSFFVGKDRRIEVFDTFSDALVYDVEKHELLLCPLLQTSDWETYPVFSADGKTIYYSTSKPCRVPAEYDKAKYSLCSIGFDNGVYANHVDTLFSARLTDKSYTFPRPSYDGKWLMYSVTDFGNFPVNHKEADLWLLNISTGEARSISEVNSDDVDSFHNWSADSHWFVFSSRRGDGMYNKVYIACINDDGTATKPFLLPQRNPRLYYSEQFQSFNCPDFIKTKVNFDVREAGKAVRSEKRTGVKVK